MESRSFSWTNRRRLCWRFWFCPEFTAWHDNAYCLFVMEYFCPWLFKTAFGAGRSDRGICGGHWHGQGGFIRNHGRWDHFPSEDSAIYAGISSGSDFLCLHHIPCVCGGNHLGYIGWYPVVWTEQLKEKKFQVHWPVTAMYLHFLHCWDVLRSHPFRRISVLLPWQRLLTDLRLWCSVQF